MEIKGYRPRIIENKLKTLLSAMGAVVIVGPKWCGKTWIARHFAKSEILLQDPTNNYANRKLANANVMQILVGETPRLIDEWQDVPSVWDAVRIDVDKTNMHGKYILTGSTTPRKNSFIHSGAGRIGRLRLRTMSLYESGKSTGEVSLYKLCNGEEIFSKIQDVKLSDLVDYVVRGGWPEIIDAPINEAMYLPKEYINALLENDLDKIDDTKRDIKKIKMLLRSLARNESTTASITTLANDIKENDENVISRETIVSYMEVLSELQLIDNQEPFAQSIRSSVRIKKAEKRHLADPSLAVALMNATPEELANDLETFGFLFEALCERDLKIYADSFDGKVYHYQDYNNNEVDAVVTLPNNEYALFEIKLSATSIDVAAKNLINIKNKIESDGKKLPKSLCVICGLANAAYRREDGVYVVPITTLKN